MPKWICRLYLTITRFCMSFRQRKKIHIGTKVYYTKHGNCISMVITDAGMIDGSGIKYFSARTMHGDHLYFNKISRMDIEKIPGWENWWYNATAWWRWYKHCWLEMDINAMSDGQELRSIFVLGKNKATARR